MKLFSGILCAAILTGMYSCRSARKINTAIAKKDTTQVVVVHNNDSLNKKERDDSIRFVHDILKNIQANRIDFSTFSAKVKVDFWDKDGKAPDLTVFVRMKKDSAIWLSVNATMFSYEAFRVLITPDSVKMINYKDKEIQLRSVSYLQEITHLPFTFSTMQDLLIGNPIFLDSNVVSYKKNADNVMILLIGDLFKNLLTVNSDLNVITNSKMDDNNEVRNRTCNISYSNYEKWEDKNFPKSREISIVEKSKLDVQMDFKQYSFNENLSYPFRLPKNYKVR